jgi:hypothetical protein
MFHILTAINDSQLYIVWDTMQAVVGLVLNFVWSM